GVAVDSRAVEETPAPALLPPALRTRPQVLALLADAKTGLIDSVGEPEPYKPRLSLDAVSTPYISAGIGGFGGSYGGGIAFSFSDILGNHTLYAVIDANSYGGTLSDIPRNTG